MTIGTIVIIAIVVIIGIGVCGFFAWYWKENESTSAIIGAIASLLVAAVICVAIGWWQLNTESGRRAFKDQQSNLTGGIGRTVSVYDINGQLIKQYSGKFDIETDKESYILFDDENGDRHIIYYTTGTVIVDENGKEQNNG